MKNNIAHLRRNKGIKQYDLARMLRVSPSYLCKIEKGIIEPTEKFMKDCARHLKIAQDELFVRNQNGNDVSDGAAKEGNILWAVRKEKGSNSIPLLR
jgi:putative transcriptional regulator